MAGIDGYAHVSSENNFPMGAGIASSASAFAALSLAASAAYGLTLDEPALSRLARRGQVQPAARCPVDLWNGWPGKTTKPPMLTPSPRRTLASGGLRRRGRCRAQGSRLHRRSHAGRQQPLQTARLAQVEERLAICRQAILQRDFDALAAVMELDSNLMHAVMMTSTPSLFYWQPATLGILQAVQDWRSQGLAGMLHRRRRPECTRPLPAGKCRRNETPPGCPARRAAGAHRSRGWTSETGPLII